MLVPVNKGVVEVRVNVEEELCSRFIQWDVVRRVLRPRLHVDHEAGIHFLIV